ncbi:MAG: alpha/beta hydrolase [Oscillospiraceae bacterium]|jgi:pimeloyl-ACP methyl ester carboxylesterase|nr:alpha/beta hydrolase [Oscillospiraceae bacterium]
MPEIITGDGTRIHYEEYGDGDRHLLCSQVDHAGESLERTLAARGFHVWLITNRGFGLSSHVTEDYGMHWYDKFADDVIALADAKGIDRFIYSGASHGAGTGWHLVLRHPERVKAFLAAVAGPHNLDESKTSVRQLMMQGKSIKHCFEYETDDPALLARRERIRAEREALRALPDYEAVYESPETKAIDYGRPLSALETEAKVCEALRTIQTPVLLLGGVEDTIARVDLMARTVQCLPHGKLVLYSGFGHCLDIYEELAREAIAFINNVERTGRLYDAVG